MDEADIIVTTYSDGRETRMPANCLTHYPCKFIAKIAFYMSILAWPYILIYNCLALHFFFDKTFTSDKEYILFDYRYEIAMGIILVIQLIN